MAAGPQKRATKKNKVLKTSIMQRPSPLQNRFKNISEEVIFEI